MQLQLFFKMGTHAVIHQTSAFLPHDSIWLGSISPEPGAKRKFLSVSLCC